METKAFTLSECRSAVAACDRLISQADSRALAAYWQGVQDMWKAREREAERASLRGDVILQTYTPEDPCPPPFMFTNDELRCPSCGLLWPADENKPACPKGL